MEINELKEKKINIINKLNKLDNKKNSMVNDINKYNNNKTIYEEIQKLKNNLEELKNKENDYDKDCKINATNISNINKEIIKYESIILAIKKNNEIIKKNNNKKEILSIIKNATDNGGILDEIMKTIILPSMENIINDILNDVDTYKIKLSYDNNIKITKIENNTEYESSCLMASGHEKAILNIIFRLALSKLNSRILTNFFIIDEAFKNSDATKKQKLKTLFEYLRNNYDWVLVVTHDDYIKDNFDKEINIEHHNGTSLINYL